VPYDGFNHQSVIITVNPVLSIKETPMKSQKLHKDSTAWIIQSWASFLISTAASTFIILFLPMDNLIKSQLGISFLFSISSTFALAKTVRDNYEAEQLTARIDAARVEKLLSEHHTTL
jgi:hypothetical protein